MTTRTKKWLIAGALASGLGLSALTTSTAEATTGSGCYQVINVPYWDTLNVRQRPSARSGIVYRILPQTPPIISGGRSYADAMARCTPPHRPLSSRWCPVSIHDGSGSYHGWVKRRYLRASDCP